MNKEKQRPEWVPKQTDDVFATYVVEGVEGGHDGMPGQSVGDSVRAAGVPRRRFGVDDYVQGVLSGNRTILARAITLIESNAPAHMEAAQEVLKHLLPYTGKSVRVGITGVPGAGKSTFIEALGSILCDRGRKVAVLAVDPSSTVTRGSILGDKTRMEVLSRKENAFIRPSPSGGTLGGVTRKSRETMLLCEAAGFDVILVETIGVGQSEVAVRTMVDFFLLVVLTGAGDELQGIKKGVMELADAVLINKADGDNKIRALAAKADYARILHYLQPATEGWKTLAYTCSSITGEGIAEIWSAIEAFRDQTAESGVFYARRRSQTLDWVYAMVQEQLQASFFNHPGVIRIKAKIEQAIVEGRLSATLAVQELLKAFEG
ncbi:putative GTPase [Pelotomaculum sp. FP]|uniref:methylmalonyl Co-A mutase-associated GTPase MeaB n=1 Tax=Pelotomaculum sp. FP TaxID=261474 RepID=UPI001065E344|nr:methylmalonyl Co-A mutase-associated GTPase MeaB [Pelotomaculum sp. FP]TEB16743.1 putative GTPase [Pelotomaculum sp. FP]